MEKLTTRVKVAAVIAALEENKTRHQTMLVEAIEGWRKETAASLRRKADRVESGEQNNVRVNTSEPKDRSEEYERYIAFFSSTAEGEVVLSLADYERFVRDEWSWAQSWAVSNARFSETAAAYTVSKAWDE